MATEKSTEEKPKAKTPTSAAPATAAVNGLGIAALVVGCVAFLSGFVPVWGFLVGVTAIVLGAIALKKYKNGKGMSIAGIVLGAVGALTSLVFGVIWIIGLFALGTAATVSTGSLGELSKVADAAKSAFSAQDALAKKQIDAKKDFAKGETADFGKFTVKVNSVDANYIPSSSYSAAASSEKYVVVNVTVTNPNEEAVDVSSYSFKLSADGVANSTSYLSIDSEFKGGELAKGASSTGNLVYSVADTATTLKLKYDDTVVVISPYEIKTLTYTLAL